MKTIFLLNRDDLRAIGSGDPFELQIGGTTAIFQYEHARRSNGTRADADDPNAPLVSNSAKCHHCKRRKGQRHTANCRYTTKSKTAKQKTGG